MVRNRLLAEPLRIAALQEARLNGVAHVPRTPLVESELCIIRYQCISTMLVS